jgi:hypothetical protein
VRQAGQCSAPYAHHISTVKDQWGNRAPTNEFDENPISDVRFVPISRLEQYGFSARFVTLIKDGFPGAGGYMGLKSNIGL